MPIRLALVSSPISLEERYGQFSGAANTEPSFGLVCLAAAAEDTGARVTIVEASSQNLSVEQTQNEIVKFEPDGRDYRNDSRHCRGRFACSGSEKRSIPDHQSHRRVSCDGAAR